MGSIRELSASVINQIAAGEVIERPSSVVKELLENAVDAGGSRIDLTVERGGKDLVRISDNGKGMDREDLPKAFLPHATSKLESADDLFAIRTLGFRGEALAAIAEVSKVRCQTRTEGAPHGWSLTIEGGKRGDPTESGTPIGTIMEVRNLFFNVPVRRTFLKADTTEAGHVADAFLRVAMAHPTVHFTYKSAGKVVYDLPATTGLKDRIGVFFGRELADSLLWVESNVEGIELWGYVGHPSQSRSNGKAQFLFLGGRYVRDRALSHALSEAYRGLLMVGRQPVAFLNLSVPLDQVDVNVHPTKIEVRFREPNLVYSHLLNTVRRSFLHSDLHAKLQAPPEGPAPASTSLAPALEFDEFAPALGAESPRVPDPDRDRVDSWFVPSKTPPVPYGLGQSETAHRQAALDFSAPVSGPRPVAPLSETPAPPPRVPKELPPRALQLHDSYLVAETEDGMVVIDQHALHERILFEEIKRRVQSGGVEAQGLLVPEAVDLPPADAAALLERADVLATLGIQIEALSGGTVLVQSVPAMLRHLAPERLVRDLAEHLRSKPIDPAPEQMLVDVMNMIACKAAVKAGQKLAPEEIDALLERRHLARDSHHCPHGRPTALVFTKSELEKQFGRT